MTPPATAQPAILLDFFSDLDFIQAEELGVDLLVQTVEFGGEHWLGMQGRPYVELFRRLDEGAAPPQPTPISISAYVSTLERILSRAPYVVALHPANYLSNGLEVARTAAQAFPGQVGVVDGMTISSGLALQAAWAVRQAQRGRSGPEIVAGLRGLAARQHTLVCQPSIRYMDTPSSSGWRRTLGENASVIVSGPGRQPKIVGTPHTPPLRLRIMQQYLQRYARRLPGGEITFFHVDTPEPVQSLQEQAVRLGLQVRWTVEPGPVCSTQMGWGAYGFSIVPSDSESGGEQG